MNMNTEIKPIKKRNTLDLLECKYSIHFEKYSQKTLLLCLKNLITSQQIIGLSRLHPIHRFYVDGFYAQLRKKL